MQSKVIRRVYEFPLTDEQWDRLNSLEFRNVDREMMSVGADNVDYNGHFGSAIFFSIDHDTDTTVEKVEAKILEIVSRDVKPKSILKGKNK